jgi:hypothetical protein
MARPELVRTGQGIDMVGLAPFRRALAKASKMAARDLREEMRAAGEIVAKQARDNAGQHSTSIPPTIKTQVRSLTVSVVAGKGVPLAALYEVGNAQGGTENSFKHPVFGNREAWVTQTGYPFLKPAVDAKMPEVEAGVMKVADGIAEVLAHAD